MQYNVNLRSDQSAYKIGNLRQQISQKQQENKLAMQGLIDRIRNAHQNDNTWGDFDQQQARYATTQLGGRLQTGVAMSQTLS